ncbi:uncharacterized protein LOC133902204 [Phragmites australis]|uniref:uncharacterized protein LOC133902204 n=1 Tax=Phragmites australis TaxID=29695 RepID=UPI002D773D25|nr:uncharacterized protein LOC133902204 [Phragmites australis]XP_062199785.1 uncharacterized protein LOC133902204 [Phragmites australis]
MGSVMNKDNVHDKETHGTSNDITKNTSVDKVKGPNLLERAKEEIEALAGAVHTKMEHHSSPSKKDESHKEDKEGNLHKIKTHTNETHGTSNDISEDTPVDKVKGPNVFERAKEEIEAIVEAIHPKKGSDSK